MTDYHALPLETLFYRVAVFTLGALFVLIFVGALVRATGSGMGCPDWPTCFGQWIPPTQESQLPENYHQLYAQRGYANTDFNPAKTWTEYFNRLTGVTIGLLVFLTMLLSFQFRKTDQVIVYSSIAVFLLVGLQGWLGALVVASNLRPIMISVHMLSALTIVGLLIYTIVRSQQTQLAQLEWRLLPKSFKTVLTVAIIFVLIQVLMGTQVRQAVDTISQQLGETHRQQWRNHFPLIFYVHRSFSAIILFTVIWLAWNSKQLLQQHFWGKALASLVVCAVVIEIMLGITMDRFAIPAFAQPLHLLFASLIFGGLVFSRIAIQLGTKTPEHA
ncbi:MAG TPA: heme A synthase [Crenotrichaceae bacterium]|nr:heme A synthase [Crenotrichaceae bacterium]